MAQLGTLRSYKFTEDADDIRGAKLYGRDDDKLGEISDVIFDHESGDIKYAVVDTGGWFTHKEFLVPADQITVRNEGNRDNADVSDNEYRVNLSKEQVERFPKYDANDVNDQDRFGEYEKRYREQAGDYFASSGILHRADSANVITPPGMPATGREDLPPIDARLTHRFSDQTAGPMNTTATAWGQSSDNQDRLTPQSDISLTKPQVQTTSTDEVDDEISASDRDRGRGGQAGTTSADLPGLSGKQSGNQPFRNADVGAPGTQSTRLEQDYMQRDAEEYRESRAGARIPGESTNQSTDRAPNQFTNQGSSVSSTEIIGNSPNTSDSELRTAEGDAVFNNADQQSGGLRKSPASSTERQDGTNLGSRVGSRWDRFQNRIRDERQNIAGRRETDNDEAA